MPKQVNIKRQKTKKTKAKSVLQKRRVPTTVVQVFDIYGRSQGTAVLPKEIFGQKPNEKLLSQAIRVYQVNQIPHKASTKSRGEVRGGGAKPWRQKHTGLFPPSLPKILKVESKSSQVLPNFLQKQKLPKTFLIKLMSPAEHCWSLRVPRRTLSWRLAISLTFFWKPPIT